MKVEPGKRYWRSDGTITPILLPPVNVAGWGSVAQEPQGRAYDHEGHVYPPIPGTDPLRLVQEYNPPVEVFTEYRIHASVFNGMTVNDSPGSGCVQVEISGIEADSETLRLWAAVLLDMAETLDNLPK